MDIRPDPYSFGLQEEEKRRPILSNLVSRGPAFLPIRRPQSPCAVESTGAHEAVVRNQGSGFFVGHVSPVAWRAEVYVKRGAGEIASATTGLAENDDGFATGVGSSSRDSVRPFSVKGINSIQGPCFTTKYL